MASTPEAKVKLAVRRILGEYDRADVSGYGRLYQHWPVMNGMGRPSLDCIVCYYGMYIAIETKAPGRSPTPRQELTIKQIHSAGGIVLVIDGPEGYESLRSALNLIKWSHAGTSQPKA
jgi:hypothetical protein